MGSTLHLGCIGCGFIGRIHLQNVQKIPQLTVSAFADRQEEAARECHFRYGGRYHTSDPEKILRDPDIDAVLICTWHDSHLELALEAAREGKHILMEKPMAMTTSDCLKIEKAVETAGVKLMVDFKFRFAPAVLRAKQAVPRPTLTVGQSFLERPPSRDSWIFDPEKGGGPILSGGCHNYDLLYFLSGSEPARIHAEGGSFLWPQSDDPDNVVATISFANGALGTFVQGMGRTSAWASKWFFELFSPDTAATIREHCQEVEITKELTEVLSFQRPDVPKDAVGTLEVLEAFAACILDDGEPSPGPRDGTRATYLVEATMKSLKTGQPEVLDPSQWS